MAKMEIGAHVKISPDLTGEDTWVDAVVKEVKNNPFNGIVVYAQAV